MSNPQFLVFSNPVEGREDEYNEWYDKVHLRDVCNVPGVAGAKRYELVPTGDETPAHSYLAVYDLDGDPNAVLAELMTRFGGPQMAMSEALDMATIGMSVWQQR